MTIEKFAEKYRLKTRIDEDGTKIIPGRVGHLYEYDDEVMGVIVMPVPPRKQYWGYTRTALISVGCSVVQDGDGEGAATFDPANLEQVKAALKAARVKKRKLLTPEDSARRAALIKTISATSRKASASDKRDDDAR